MFYILPLIFNAIIATFLAGLASLVAGLLPVKSNRFRIRLLRGTAAFFLIWFAVMIYGFIDMSGTHHVSLSKAEGAEAISDLVHSSDQVLRAERVYAADTAQTYVLVRMTADEVEAFAKASLMKTDLSEPYNAAAQGWPVPDWWPIEACPGAISYQRDPFANPPSYIEYFINWCPSEGKAYVQHLDY